MLSQQRKQFLLSCPDNGVVLSLINSRLYKASLLANLEELLNFRSRVVGQSKTLKLALSVGLVNGLCSLLKRHCTIGLVQVLNVDLGNFQSLQRAIDALSNLVLCVSSLTGGNLCANYKSISDIDRTESRLA